MRIKEAALISCRAAIIANIGKHFDFGANAPKKVAEFLAILKHNNRYKMEKINLTDELRKFGENVRTIRKSKGLTLEVVSAHSGIDTSDIGKIERGEINLSFTSLFKLSIGLGVSLQEIVDY